MESEDDWNVDKLWNECNAQQQELIQRDRVILKNLPAELAIDGIRNICEEYGKVTNVSRPPDKNYAFVTFETPA